MKKKTTLLLMALLLFGVTREFHAQTLSCTGSSVNLVVNPDFSGGMFGFTSQLPASSACALNSYTVETNFNLKCPSSPTWPNVADHTGPTSSPRNYLMVDGSTTLDNQYVWREPVTVCLGKTYSFSFWGQNVNAPQGPTNMCNLLMAINGATVLSTGELTQGVWTQYSYSWTSTLTGVMNIDIIQATKGDYRDFGIDDVIFGYCCTPLSVTGNFSISPGSTASLTASGATTYTWSSSTGTVYTGSTFTVSPLVTTVYTITGTQNCACITPTTVTVTVACDNPVNLVVNPAFSSGIMGFSSSVPASAALCATNTYTVESNFTSKCGGWMPLSDHTGGGLFMIVSGPTGSSNQTIWQQTVNVCQGNNYIFSFWVGRTDPLSPAPSLSVKFGTGAPINLGVMTLGGWNQYAASYTGITGPLVISIIQNSPVANHYGIDDISFGYCCPKVSASGSFTINAGDNTVLTGVGGNSFTWSDASGVLSTSTSFTAAPLVTTVYTLTGSNGCGCSSATTITVTVIPCPHPNNLVVNPAFTLGNTGFSSSVPASAVLCATNTYTVESNFTSKCSSWAPLSDHTGGGLFMIVSGATTLANQTIWQQTVNVCQGKVYTFSLWLGQASPIGPAPALSVKFGAAAAINLGTTGLPGWNQYAATYTGISGPLVVSIIQNAPVANHYGIDDVYFGYCCAPISVTGNTVLCPGATATLTGNGANSFTWTSASTTNTGVTVNLTPTVTTVYTVTGSDGCGCSSSITVTVNVITCKTTGIQAESTTNIGSIQVFPNPNKGVFTVSLNAEQENDVFVYNALGQLVYSVAKSKNPQQKIDISSFPAGIYTIRVLVQNQVYSQKVIKE